MTVVHSPAMATSRVVAQNMAATLPGQPGQVKSEHTESHNSFPGGAGTGFAQGQPIVQPRPAPPAHSHHTLPAQQPAKQSFPCPQPPQDNAHKSVNQDKPVTNQVKEEPLGKDPIDIASVRCLFGWSPIDGISVPHLLREDKEYVAVRIVEQKLLSRFPNTFPEELGEHEPLVSYYVTQNEIKLLDDINSLHCTFEYGRQPFTAKDLIVKLSEFEKFYSLVKTTFPVEVLESRRLGIPLMKPSELAKTKSGWIQVNNTVTPYFRRDSVKYVVLQIIKHAAKLLQNVEVTSILPNEEEYKLINDMCKGAGVEFQFAKNTRLVSLEDVKRHHKVTLRELPANAPKDYAEFIGDSKEDEENQKPSTSVPMTLPNQKTVASPASGSLPPQHNGGYPFNQSTQHMQPGIGAQQHIANMPVPHPFGAQPSVSAQASGQYSSRNVTPHGLGYQQFPYPIRTLNLAQNQIVTPQRPRPPPPYPGRPARLPGNQQMPPISTSSQIALADYVNRRAALMQNRRMPAPQSSDQSLHSSATRLTSSVQSAMRGTPPAASMSGVMGVSGSQLPFIPNNAQGLMPPRMSVQTLQQRPVNPPNISIVQTLPNQMPPVQQQAQFFMPMFNQPRLPVGAEPMPGMNNILQRPPFQTSLSNSVQQATTLSSMLSTIAPVASAQGNDNTALLKQALNTSTQAAIMQQPSSVQSFQHAPFLHIAPKTVSTARPALPNTYQPKTSATTPSLPGQINLAQAVPPAGQSGVVPIVSVCNTNSTNISQNQVSVNNVPSNIPSPTQSVPSTGNSAHSTTVVNTAIVKPMVSSKPPEEKPEPRLPVTEEAAEVIKIAKCITGVRFESKSISCLEYGNLQGKYALVEAVSKLYFSQCTLNEFLFILEQVLFVPTTTCEPNEEKAFILYYNLPAPVLKCNKMVKLEDLTKYFPQLTYTCSKKNVNNMRVKVPKVPNTLSAPLGVPDDDDNVIFVEETLPGKSTEKNVQTLANSATASTSVRPSGAAKRKHYSGSGQPSKQPRRLEDALQRLKQKPETSVPEKSYKSRTGAPVNNKPSPQTEDDSRIIVLE